MLVGCRGNITTCHFDSNACINNKAWTVLFIAKLWSDTLLTAKFQTSCNSMKFSDTHWFKMTPSPSHRLLGLGGVFSLILGMGLLTHKPSLMSLLVHLFFNIQHLTPSVVLKYQPTRKSKPPPPDSSTMSRVTLLHHRLILLAPP